MRTLVWRSFVVALITDSATHSELTGRTVPTKKKLAWTEHKEPEQADDETDADSQSQTDSEISSEDWSDRFWRRELKSTPFFEWYKLAWADVRHLFPHGASPILHVGCGTSSWPRQMADDGLDDVIHIDGSNVLVEELRRRDPDLTFQAMDATALDLPSESFGVVIEKGLLDGLMLGSLAAASAAARELHRVLRPGGILISVSMYGGHNETGPVLGAAPWASQVFEFLEAKPEEDDAADAEGGDGDERVGGERAGRRSSHGEGAGGGVVAQGVHLCRK